MAIEFSNKKHSRFSTEFTVKADSKEELDKWIEGYKLDYHPAGYGTTVTKTSELTANVYRQNSCD